MFTDLDFQEETILQMLDFLAKDLENYKKSANPKELYIKKQQRVMNVINSYMNAVVNTIDQYNGAIERLQNYKEQTRRLEIENKQIKENYLKLKLYAKAHGIDTELVEHYSHLKDFYA